MRHGGEPWELMPNAAAEICKREQIAGRGPVSIEQLELAILSRLRFIKDFSTVAGASEGLDVRFKRYAHSESSVMTILERVKTKRYAMSRLRRMLMCAVLGISSDYVAAPPPYIRVLGMNDVGKKLLGLARKKAQLPIITKPASAHTLPAQAADMFRLEAAATDFYVLAHKDEKNRQGGQEWRQTPIVI